MIRFSEAIRLGAMMGPQLFGQELSMEDPTASCAFGGAILAAGVEIKPPTVEYGAGLAGRSAKASGSVTLPDEWKPFCLSVQSCPAEHSWNWKDQGIHIVAHLNDYHHWSREQIADWVATVEPQEELAPPSVPIYEESPEEVIA